MLRSYVYANDDISLILVVSNIYEIFLLTHNHERS